MRVVQKCEFTFFDWHLLTCQDSQLCGQLFQFSQSNDFGPNPTPIGQIVVIIDQNQDRSADKVGRQSILTSFAVISAQLTGVINQTQLFGQMVLEQVTPFLTVQTATVIVLVLALITYYKRLVNYKVLYKGNYDVKMKKHSKSLPAFTNGWFIVGASGLLGNEDVINVDKWGENIALFRGKDGVLYALEAYCQHMGANLGIQGTVKHDNCIQCPFHGWTYSGETGHCVDQNKKPIKGISYQYNNNIGEVGKKVEWTKCQGQDIKLKKYPVKEINGFIYIWIHALPQFAQDPQYQPLDTTWLMSFLEHRGQARNIIKCHAQDIAENGADTMHFYYVHRYLHKAIRFVEMMWLAVWKKGDDPAIAESFDHPRKGIQEWKQQLYRRYIKNNSGASNIGVLHVDCYIKLPFLGSFYFFTITAFQVGPAIVDIFVKSHFFTVVYLQYIHTNGNYDQDMYHQTYTSSWMPYWLSAFFIKLEALQVYNDSLIWDAKTFKTKVTYQKTPGDDSMRKWREWYGTFYEGRKEKQEQQGSLSW